MINQLTFTRFIAAIFIIILHFGTFLKIKNYHFINSIWEHLNLGVSYFYVLSGFVMVIAYSKNNEIDHKKYYINRFARIYPLHILALILTIIFGYLITVDFKIAKLSILSNLLLIQSWIPRTVLTLNSPAWSISVEAFFYLLFPFLLRLLYKMNIGKIILYTVSFNVICQIVYNYYFFSDYYTGFNPDGYFLFYNPLLHLNSFLIGILFGFIYKKQILKSKNYDIHILILTCIMVYSVYLLRNIFIHNGFFALFFGIIILLFSHNKGYLTKLFSNKKLIHLGNISFAIYLLQHPIYLASTYILNYFQIQNLMVIFFVSLLILIIVSHYVYIYFETFVQDIIKKYFIKKIN